MSTTAQAQAQVAPWWNHGLALRTRLFDGLSLMLPTAEQFLLDTLDAWLQSEQVPAEHKARWAAEVASFMQDERKHQRAHQLDRQRLHTEGLPTKHLTQGIDDAVRQLQKLPLNLRLSVGAAFEELTALWSHEIIHREVWLDRKPNTQTRLWRWHCNEELGHHSLMPSLEQALGVSRRTRLTALLMASGCLAWDTLSLWRALCAHDLRTQRSTRLALVGQGVQLSVQALPSVARMGWGWLKLLGRSLR